MYLVQHHNSFKEPQRRIYMRTQVLVGIVSVVAIFLFSQSAVAGEDIDYSVNGEPYEGYLVNSGSDAPTILLLHDWDGLTGYEKKRSEMLAKLGYSVFAADLFGKGVRPTTVTDKKQHTGELYKDRKKLRSLVAGAFDTAMSKGLNSSKVVVIGYCFGGAAVLEYARSGAPATGFVTFHGGLKTPEGQDYSQAKGQFLIFHGSADTNITMKQFAALNEELEEYHLAHEMISYGGAPHAFTVFDSKRYNENADKKSWQRFVEWLGEVF